MSDERDRRESDARARAAVTSALETAIDVVASLAAVPVVGPMLSRGAKAMVQRGVGPSPADARIERADAELAAERAHQVPAIQQRQTEAEALFRQAIDQAAKTRADAFRRELAELISNDHLRVARTLLESNQLDDLEVSATPVLRNALYRLFRESLDAVHDETVPAFARLAIVYQDRPLNRTGQCMAEFLRLLEPYELEAARRTARAIERVLQLDPRLKEVHMRAGREHVAVRTTQLWGGEVVLLEPPHEGVHPIAVLRLLVRTEVGYAPALYRDTMYAALRSDIARAVVFVVLGVGPRPPAPA